MTTHCNLPAREGHKAGSQPNRGKNPTLVPTAPQGLEVSRLGKDG